MRRWMSIMLCMSGCQRCGAIDPIVDPDDTEDPSTEETDETEESDTIAESTPEPPCDMPEVEPNNSAETANLLPMEKVACGTFETEYDGDFWSFEVKDAGWLAVDVTGLILGSDAKLSLTLSSDDGVRVGMNDSNGLPEAHVRLPVQPARYQALVRQSVGEAGGQGSGEDYFYELRASSTKPPVSWDVVEGANEARLSAQRLLGDGAGQETVFGTIDSPTDQDWYEVRIPAARFRLEADVTAHEAGSGGDFALQIWRDGVHLQTWSEGPVGWERDPYFLWQSLQGETLQVRVVEEGGDAGVPYWYALTLTMVEE